MIILIDTIKSTLAKILILACLLACTANVNAESRVLLETSMGDIVIELYPDVAPGHVQNFLNYVNDGDYDKSFLHRSVSGFIVQGGGFAYIESLFYFVPTDPPIANEFAMSNVRGTVAMAKLGGDPNSATSQWFINLADNSANLDAQNGGFTVFGTVVSGMDVVDAVAALPTDDLVQLDTNLAVIGNQIPLRNLPFGEPLVLEDHLVMINNATQSSFAVPAMPDLFGWLLVALLGMAASFTLYRRSAPA